MSSTNNVLRASSLELPARSVRARAERELWLVSKLSKVRCYSPSGAVTQLLWIDIFNIVQLLMVLVSVGESAVGFPRAA